MVLHCQNKFSPHLLFLFIFGLSLILKMGAAQSSLFNLFSDVELRIDTNIFKYSLDRIYVENEWKLPFEYQENNPIVEFRLFPRMRNGEIVSMSLKPANEYKILDSLTLRIDGYYHCKVQFQDLSQATFLNLNIAQEGQIIAIPIFPYTHTYATIYPGDGDLYIGDEKTFELVTNHSDNIIIDPLWKQKEGYEYRIHRSNDKIWLSFIPTETGTIEVDFTIDLYRPNIENRRPKYKLDKQIFTFNVKGSRL